MDSSALDTFKICLDRVVGIKVGIPRLCFLPWKVVSDDSKGHFQPGIV